MGVVIYFEGRLKSEKDLARVMTIANQFAEKYNFDSEIIDEKNKALSRVRGEEEWDYEGPVRGIKLNIAEWAEPVWLGFDENLYLQDFCKTQFADITTHILLVELLREIAPCFNELEVFDEGEFWETGNLTVLSEQREAFFEALTQAQKENPALEAGPFRTREGRIIDAMG
jgi:hypothetical protein